VDITVSTLISIVVVLTIRIWAIKYNIALPKFKTEDTDTET
jgi:uncharacterized membrane protein YeiH